MNRIFLSLIILILSSNLAFGHPPSAINVKYDPAAKEVTATIAHQVGNPRGHFIDKVTIKVNQDLPVLQRFSFQRTAKEQIAVFAIPNVKSGDIIVIEANCNKGGRLSQQVRIE